MKINDTIIKLIVGGVVLSAFLFMVISAVFIPNLSENHLITHIVGMIEGAVVTIVAFYFGSSKSSQDKDRLKKEQDYV